MIAQEEKSKPATSHVRKNAVVIVDDQAETLASLSRLLGEEPYTLTTFLSAEEALRWMARNPVDLLIADERMPEMRGSDLLDIVRERYPDTVRVILTGYPGSSTVSYGLSHGIEWLISKPWNNDALKLTIHQLLEGRELRKRFPNSSGSRPGDDPTGRPAGAPTGERIPAGLEGAAPVPLQCVASDGRILWATEALFELLGKGRSEVVGRSIAEFHEDGIGPADLLTRLSREDRLDAFPARLRRADGTIRPVMIDAAVHREDGRFVHAWAAVRPDVAPPAAAAVVAPHDLRDLSAEVIRETAQRKRAEDTLRLSEMKFRLLVEGVKDYAILLLSPDGIVVSWNEGAQRINGYSAEEILGRHFSVLYVPEDVEAGKPRILVEAAREQGRAEDRGWRLRKDGTRFWSNVVLTALRDPSGNLLGFAKVTRDMTEQNRVQEERDRLNAQMFQGQKLQAIGQLSAGMAHEINNPVGYILSNLNTMGEYCRDLERLLGAALQAAREDEAGRSPSAALTEFRALAREVRVEQILPDLGSVVSDCKLGGERIRDIVRSLREFSHVDEGELKDTDLNKCLEDSLRICWNEIKYKAEVQKDYGALPPVPCFPQRLGQVFINLLVNAGQAIEKKGKIFLTTRREGDWIVIRVRDTGRGIEPANLRRVFEPFFTTKTVGSGTGLGLHVAYRIVIAHGGKIEVQSKVDEGTEFAVHLPVAGPRGAKP